MRPRSPLSVWTYTVRNVRKILPTLIILTFVVMIVIIILSTLRGIKDGAIVYTREMDHFTVVIPKRKTFLTPEIRKLIASHDSVERVVESRNASVNVRALIARFPFAIRSVSEKDRDYVMKRLGTRLLEGKLPDHGTNEVALHEMFMKANSWKIGQEFGMEVSDDDWMPGRFKVVGILGGDTPTGIASFEFLTDPTQYFYSLKLGERSLVFAKPGRDKEMNDWLKTIPELRVWDRATAEREIGNSFDRLLLIVNFISILLITVVALVVGLIHNIFFAQRTDEFAILLAVGHTQGRLLAKVVLETALLMSFAWLAGTGAALGILTAFQTLVLDPRGIPLPVFQPLPILVSLSMPIVAQLFATGTVFGRLRRLDPIQIIERRG